MRDERKRRQNERKFDDWEELPDGGRRYSYEIRGRRGWFARYVKEVDVSEKTIRFWQEIYDDRGQLTEIHEKYPEDRGHTKIRRD
ncbi:MAG TPA: hypothetical protein ENK58_00195 [Desulfobacterales bacterium]|nr:MAG: hypothetical protein DRI57_17135 [Deltaproteobacteria bacterium]HHC23822.1 hypothetical protein [Desulfobacterales bacterium]